MISSSWTELLFWRVEDHLVSDCIYDYGFTQKKQ